MGLISMEKISGLSTAEAKRLLLQYGRNEIAKKSRSTFFTVLIEQFKDYMVLVLIAAAVISAFMGEFTDAISILVIILANAILGIVQSYRTEHALESLTAMSAPTTRVLRDGSEKQVPSAELVVGDIMVLRTGDRIGADGLLIERNELACDESMLTGESVPVRKTGRDRRVHMGTMVTSGNGLAQVKATGMETEMGKIAGMLGDAKTELTPLQKRLKNLGKTIVACCLVVCAGVSVTGIMRGESVLDMLLSGISLAVAAIPEGLPAVVTVSLAMGITRMSKRAAIIRRINAVETLGCVEVICSDKTGTLTENKMTVTDVYYGGTLARFDRKNSVFAKMLFEAGLLCSNARIEKRGGATVTVGDPTEAAIVAAAAELNISRDSFSKELIRVKEHPFTAERKRMSVVCRSGVGHIAYAKGAPEILLPRCVMFMQNGGFFEFTPEERAKAASAAKNMASSALRVIAVAFKPGLTGTDIEDAENDLVFLGLIGMLDPPRPEAAAAVEECVGAGIRPVMITGDHKDTALAIAEKLKIARRGDRILTGAELDRMDEDALARVAGEVSVYARVSPKHKYMIVRALKKIGRVTAMTGDGVNDAPAVKEADIGIAMGKNGTDVTKEASVIVLQDDNFASIVAVVRQGRMIYDNIRKFIRYMLSSNLGEVLTMFVAMLLTLPLPLLPPHILLINLVTDGLPAMALSLDPPDGDVMSRLPRGRNEGIFAHGLAMHIILRGIFIGLSTVGVFYFAYQTHDVSLSRTAAFLTLGLSQLIFVFECKSERAGMFSKNVFNNVFLIIAVFVSASAALSAVYVPPFARLFGLVPLPADLLLTCTAISVLAAVLSSVLTLLAKKLGRKK